MTRRSVSAYSIPKRSAEEGKAGEDDQKMRSRNSTLPIYARLRKTSTQRAPRNVTPQAAGTARETLQECWRCSDTHVRMLWIFERKGEQMRCEIRREGVGAGYEMIVTSPDGSQRMERFEETADLIKRTLDLQRDLLESGWRQPK